MLKLGTGFISICGVVVCLSRGQTQGSGEICSQFQHFSSVCVLFFSLWSPGGAAEGQMLNVRTDVSKRTCLHNVEFPGRGRSGFPCSVGMPEAGGSTCVCVCVSVFSSMTCSSTHQWCVLVQPCWAGRGSVACQSQQMSSERCAFIVLMVAVTL